MSMHLFRSPRWLATTGLELRRGLATSSCLCGNKTRTPFDKRFPISPKDVNEYKEGGSKEMRQILGRTGHMVPQPPGYYTKDGKFVFVPEMVPEFVVPDLTDFKLKPYVSYKVTDIKQSEFTARDFFDSVYGKKIVDDFREGKLQEEDAVRKYTSDEKS